MSVRYKRDGAVEFVELDSECVLFQAQINKFYVLNQTAAAIWARLAEPVTSSELATDISDRFTGITADEAQPAVEETLREMLEQRLVVTSSPG